MILFQICCEPLRFNLCVESGSSKLDVYEMRGERRNERADKRPAGADSVVEQKRQQSFTVEVFSCFNKALSLTAGFPAAFEPALVLSRCDWEEHDDYGRAG